jgi:hypothetical protein
VAKAGVRGRPIVALMLSAEEQAYLERQVRRHRIARSLSERCRVIRRCADGMASKEVAAEFGLHEHTVGKSITLGSPEERTHEASGCSDSDDAMIKGAHVRHLAHSREFRDANATRSVRNHQRSTSLPVDPGTRAFDRPGLVHGCVKASPARELTQ